jgi:hypothetical protein
MTPAATAALVVVFAIFVVGLVWRLVRGEARHVWLLFLPVAAFATAGLLAPDYRLWELAACVTVVAALSVQPLFRRRPAVLARASGAARDPDAADIPLPAAAVHRTRPQSHRRYGWAALGVLVLLNVAIAGTALLRTSGWYGYSVSRSLAASERCFATTAGGATPVAVASVRYGPHVLAVRAPGGLHGSAVFLDSTASARRFVSDTAASTSLASLQRGPIVLLTLGPVDGAERRRLGSCLRVVEVERLSDTFGASFTRTTQPFGQARRAPR